MKRILCISNTPWHGLPSRTYELVRRLKHGHVFYIDPPYDRASPEGSHWKDEGEQVSGNITRFTAPPRPAGADLSAWLNKRYYSKLAQFIKKRQRDYADNTPALWLTEPSSVALLDRMEHGAVIYDCHESFAAGGDKAEELRHKQAQELAGRAQLVIAQSEGALTALRQWNSKAVLIPNGVNFELFEKSQDDTLAFPNDLFNVKNPIFGHMGTLSAHMDLQYVEQAAKTHPEWSFVFVGDTAGVTELDKLQALPNVYFLGAKPQKQLPTYLCRFDVAISLYRPSELSRDISPMKLYEYLASGKPIVSTPQPAQVMEFSDVVYIAGTPEEWIESCRRAAGERDAWKTRQRITYAKASSWDARAAELEHAIVEQLTVDG